jgi:hypothetical protein
VIRGWGFPYGWAPTSRREETWGALGGHFDRAWRANGGTGGALIASLIAIAVILGHFHTDPPGVVPLSREYLADAADALIRVLRKIERHAAFDVPSRMQAFFIENPVGSRG